MNETAAILYRCEQDGQLSHCWCHHPAASCPFSSSLKTINSVCLRWINLSLCPSTAGSFTSLPPYVPLKQSNRTSLKFRSSKWKMEVFCSAKVVFVYYIISYNSKPKYHSLCVSFSTQHRLQTSKSSSYSSRQCLQIQLWKSGAELFTIVQL